MEGRAEGLGRASSSGLSRSSVAPGPQTLLAGDYPRVGSVNLRQCWVTVSAENGRPALLPSCLLHRGRVGHFGELRFLGPVSVPDLDTWRGAQPGDLEDPPHLRRGAIEDHLATRRAGAQQ